VTLLYPLRNVPDQQPVIVARTATGRRFYRCYELARLFAYGSVDPLPYRKRAAQIALDREFERLTYREIASKHGLSHERVRQIDQEGRGRAYLSALAMGVAASIRGR
jgi:hypothetical protein